MADEQDAVKAQQEGETAAKGTESAIDRAKEKLKTFVDKTKESAGAANSLWKKMSNVSDTLTKNVQKAAALSDSVTQTHARLSLVVDDGGSVGALEEEIYQSAQRSRTDYMATAQTVADLGQRAGDSFSGNSEAIQFVENMNKELALAGASQEQAGAATKQLVQAMETGSLSGEGLNTILGAAPNLVQTMADSLNVPVGTLMEMASQGQLTGEIVKNSLLGATDSIEEQFGGLPMTFQQIWGNFTNEALYAFAPVLTKINELFNSDSFGTFRATVSEAIDTLADAALGAFEILGSVASFVFENWAFIAPVLYGLAAALLAYKIGTLVAAAAQAIFNASLWASPITWIIVVVVAVIVAIYEWVQSVGGLQIAWMKCMDWLLFAWDMIKIGWLILCDLFFSGMDNLKIGIFTAVFWVQDRLSQMAVAFLTVGVAIANFMGDMKVNVLTILQNMVNGAIDIINNFIGMLNNIPGVSIEAIEHVTFATKAAAENEAEKQARNAALEEFKASEEAARQKRSSQLDQMRTDADANHAKRLQEINDARAKAEADSQQRKLEILQKKLENEAQENAKKEQEAKTGGAGDVYGNYGGDAGGGYGGGTGDYGGYGGYGGYGADTAANTGDTAANTARMADSLSSSEEELKLLREIAERQAINKFTTAEVKIDMSGMTNKIEGGEDIDGFLSQFTVKLEDALYATAEGVHA